MHLSQQSGKRVHQVKLFVLQKMSVSNSSNRTYIVSCQTIHRYRVSLQQLLIHIISVELLRVEVHRRVRMWCLICFLKTTKLANAIIVMILVLLSQTKSKINIIICLLQQDMWLMACSMIHNIKLKTSRKVKK